MPVISKRTPAYVAGVFDGNVLSSYAGSAFGGAKLDQQAEENGASRREAETMDWIHMKE